MGHRTLRRAAIGTALAASLVAFFFLPGALPPSWGLPAGLARWASRALTAFFLPAVAAAMSLLFTRLVRPDGYSANRGFQAAYALILDTVVVFILGLHAILLATLLVGPAAWLGTLLPLLLGAALLVAGNVFPRLRPNVVVGIRTPWTLGDRQVWARVHRIGGYAVVALGLLVIATTLVARGWLAWVAGGGLGLIVVTLGGLSWLIALREQGTPRHQAPQKGSRP